MNERQKFGRREWIVNVCSWVLPVAEGALQLN